MQTIEQIETALAALNAQRSVLGGEIVDMMIAPLQLQLLALRQPEPAPMGERKLVTIMFADISGFTAMSESLDPEQVRRLMNGCFDALVPCIHRYGGTVDKFIGDAVMSLFGAPVAQENHAESAARASLEMLGVIAQFNQAEGTSLGIHIGINTGLVIAGGMGSQDHQQYSVMGDAVNLAARFEDASERGEILIGAATYRLIAPLFDVETRAPIALKGKSEPVPNFRLLAPTSVPGTLRGLPGLKSPLVGRAREQLRLQEAVAALSEDKGKGARYAILGDAGIGKSRLISEIRQTQHAAVSWVEGRALSYTTQMSFFMARQLLLNAIGMHSGADVAAIDAALRRSVESISTAVDASDVYITLARLLDLPSARATTTFDGVTPQGLRTRMLSAYTTYIRARAHDSPLVMVWEDLHWADPSSLALLDLLLPLSDEVPLLLLLALRGDENPALNIINNAATKFHQRFEVFRLTPLSDTDSEHLLDNLLNVKHLPRVIRRLILDKAEGNAFFIEEIIRSLIDAGMLFHEGEDIQMTEKIDSLRAVDIPPTLQGVIAARIDRLPILDKQTLQTAAVIGRLFQRPVLAQLYKNEIEGAEIIDAPLLHLLERELIRQGDGVDYIFKHAATHDVAYSTLLLEQRKRLHQSTAEAIETLFPDDFDELAPTLGAHYKNAGLPHKAVPHLLRAADRAKKTYANAEAISYYTSALEQVDRAAYGDATAQSSAAIGICEHLGNMLVLTGQRDEARIMFQRGLDALGDRNAITRCRLNRLMANAWILNRHRAEAERFLLAAQVSLGEESPEHQADWWDEFIELGLERLWFMYWFFQSEGLMRELVDGLEPSINRYANATQRCKYYRSRALYELSRCHWYQPGEHVVALADQAVAAAKQGATMVDLCFALFGSAFIHLWRDELDTTLSLLSNMIPLAERCGDAERLVMGVNYIALTYRRLRNVEQTQLFAERTLILATGADMPTYVGMAKGNLAWVALQRGNSALAEQYARAGLTLLAPPIPASWAVTMPLVAALHNRGETVESVALLEKTLAGLQRFAPPVEVAIKAVTAANNAKDMEATRSRIGDVLSAAEQHNYL